MEQLDDFIEKVREENPIEDVIMALGFPLRMKGHMAIGDRDDCNTLNVRTDWQHAWWYGDNWHGDVFAFVQKVRGCDFMEAVEYLADRAHLKMPQFQKIDEGELLRKTATADVFAVAAGVFHRWLMGDEQHKTKADADALAYVRGRCWTDDTTRKAMSGFSGRRDNDWFKNEMLDEFSIYGIDPLSPQAVAVLGFKGDVEGWARKHGNESYQNGLLDHPDFNMDWIEWGYITGLMSRPGLIYAHQRRGKVEYMSRRNLPGFDTETDPKTQKKRPNKSYNPHKCLVGEKQFYYNFLFSSFASCVMVEGQGDAKTYGQWGQSSVALMGMVGDIEQLSEDAQERIMRFVHRMKKLPALYYAPDEDESGEKAVRTIGKLFGPKIQIVRMIRPVSREDAKASIEAEETNEASNVEE